MSEVENARARAEALRSAAPMSSADKARFWAGLNRYLATEVELARKTAAAENEPAKERPARPVHDSA